jgi:hypothetical protein
LLDVAAKESRVAVFEPTLRIGQFGKQEVQLGLLVDQAVFKLIQEGD